MAGELDGKVAIVTGGAGGIGLATAEVFVEEGARVVVADVNAEEGEKVVARLGESALFQRTDVSVADQIQAAVDFAIERFGALDVMVNNAGVGMAIGRFLDDDFSDFERITRVNLLGVMVGTQRAARHMVTRRSGSIINTSSIAALKPGGGVMSYRAAKAGVVQFTKCAAMELGEYNVRVNCIAPGLIPTGITNYDMAPVRAMMQPLDRAATVRDAANGALFLASERSAQVTGLVLPVDGGTNVGSPMRPPA